MEIYQLRFAIFVLNLATTDPKSQWHRIWTRWPVEACFSTGLTVSKPSAAKLSQRSRNLSWPITAGTSARLESGAKPTTTRSQRVVRCSVLRGCERNPQEPKPMPLWDWTIGIQYANPTDNCPFRHVVKRTEPPRVSTLSRRLRHQPRVHCFFEPCCCCAASNAQRWA